MTPFPQKPAVRFLKRYTTKGNLQTFHRSSKRTHPSMTMTCLPSFAFSPLGRCHASHTSMVASATSSLPFGVSSLFALPDSAIASACSGNMRVNTSRATYLRRTSCRGLPYCPSMSSMRISCGSTRSQRSFLSSPG